MSAIRHDKDVSHLIEEVEEERQDEEVDGAGEEEGEEPVVRILHLLRPRLHFHLLWQIIGNVTNKSCTW